MQSRTLGRYEILSELGKGAMGIVYKARDPLIERTVAIKTVNLDMDASEIEEYEARFHQEAKAAGGLNHPNIVTVYDIGRSGNLAFMAMEYLEGQEVRAMLAGGKALPVEQAMGIAAQVAEGLAFAHDHGVVHRDVKPGNIMVVRDGLAKITDFGIARMRTGDVRTQTGVVLGSPKYMSPEQVAGKRADQRSDIFSLGVVLYEMLTGKPPFEGETMTAIMLQTLNFNPDPPSRITPGIPEILDFIVAKALAKRPDDRYQDAKEMASDLRECVKTIRGEGESGLKAPRSIESFPEAAARTLAPAGAPVEVLPRSRRADQDEEPAPTLGVSKAFDSMDATLRLAAATGMAQEFDELAKTRRLTAAPAPEPATDTPAYRISSSLPQPALLAGKQQAGLTRREKLLIAGALLAALALAVVIVSA